MFRRFGLSVCLISVGQNASQEPSTMDPRRLRRHLDPSTRSTTDAITGVIPRTAEPSMPTALTLERQHVTPVKCIVPSSNPSNIIVTELGQPDSTRRPVRKEHEMFMAHSDKCTNHSHVGPFT